MDDTYTKLQKELREIETKIALSKRDAKALEEYYKEKRRILKALAAYLFEQKQNNKESRNLNGKF